MDRQRQRLPPECASRAPGYRRGIFSQGVEYSVRSQQKGASSIIWKDRKGAACIQCNIQSAVRQARALARCGRSLSPGAAGRPRVPSF